MGIKATRALPPKLEGVRQRIELWRQTRKGRSRIPSSFWKAAVRMARMYGVNRTSQALRLDYYGLKKRVEQQTAIIDDKTETKATGQFIELAPFSSAGSCECTLELEDGGGAKMRVHLKGIGPPDLVALGRSFWNPVP